MKSKRAILISVCILLISTITGCALYKCEDTARARVIKAYPENGAKEVRPGVTQISLTFSKDIDPNSWGLTFPIKGDEGPIYIESPKIEGNQFKWIVRLEPNKSYKIEIDTVNSYTWFKDLSGNVTEPYTLTFTTGK